MTNRIAVLIVANIVGTIAAIVGCVVLVLGGYEADLNPGSLEVNVTGWLMLAVGACVAFASFVALVLTASRTFSSRG